MCKKQSYPIKLYVNQSTITTNAIIPITLVSKNSCSNSVIIGSSSITFNVAGLYVVTGFLNIINNATSNTNFQVIPIILNGDAVANVNSVTYTGIKQNMKTKVEFNIGIQINTPNTIVQLSTRSTIAPINISNGKVRISAD